MGCLNTPLRDVWADAYPCLQRIKELLEYIEVIPETHKFFAKLADMSNTERLSVNLRLVCTQLEHGPIEHILRDGLTEVEQKHLLIIQDNLPEHLLSTAHGLLNVHERWLAVRVFTKQFKKARKEDFGDGSLEKPLDPILGKAE
jgi:hypothetical protein